MTWKTLEISSGTDPEQTYYNFGQNLGAIVHLFETGQFGSHKVEVLTDYARADMGDPIEVVFFPDMGRAAIDTLGPTIWVDAGSAEEALRKATSPQVPRSA